MSQNKIQLKQIALNASVTGPNALKGASQIDDGGIKIDFTGVDAAIGSEASARATSDSALQTNITNEESARIAADGVLSVAITAEESARIAAEAAALAARTAIQTDVDQNEADADAAIAAEATRALAAEGGLNTAIGQEAAARIAADGVLATSVSDEESARIAADTAIRGGFLGSMHGLDQAMATKEAASDAADLVLTNALAAEATTARAAESANAAAAVAVANALAAYESSNSAALTAETNASRAAEVANANAITAEIARASGAEGVNAAGLASEITRASAAEVVNASGLAAELTARAAADSVLTAGLATETARVDAILLASDADKDSFAEIVTLINDIDTVNDDALAVVIGNLNTEITATNADIAAAAAARGVIQADVDANETASVASFGAATTDRAAVRSEFAAADAAALTASQAAASTEQAARIAAEAAIQADVNANEVASLASFAAAATARAAIVTQHGVDDGIASTDRAAIRSEFAAADSALSGALTAAYKGDDTTAANYSIAQRALIQAELDASQVGAGLNADGTYAPDVNKFYIGTASSLQGADFLLDAALKGEESLRMSADQAHDAKFNSVQNAVGLSPQGGYIVPTGTSYLGLSSSMSDADAKLDAAITALAGSTAAAQASTRVFNFYKEVKVEAKHDVSGAWNEMMIFALPGSYSHPAGSGKEKMVMEKFKTYEEWKVSGQSDFSKIQIFLNGVMLQGGFNLMQEDYVMILGPVNPGTGTHTDPMEIHFAEGLLEDGDCLQVYASFL